MEATKLSKVITALISLMFLANCAGVQTVTETQGSFSKMPYPSTLGENEAIMAPGMLWNGIQYLRFNLNKEEKLTHQSAVYHALNNSELGIITQWNSKKRMANGKVRVIHQTPTSNGYCRTYQAFIQLNGAARHFTNRACRSFGNNWVFLK
jgi:surface antigen